MGQWYVAIDQVEHGPLDDNTLHAWIMRGRLRPEHTVRQHNRGNWVAARHVFPLWFDAAESRAGEPSDVPSPDEHDFTLPAPSPISPFRGTSLTYGLVGCLLMPIVVGIAFVAGLVAYDGRPPLFGIIDSDQMLLWGCMVLAVLGVSLSLHALIAGWKEIRDMRFWKRSRHSRGHSILGCVMGVLGVVLNGLGVVAFFCMIIAEY